MASGRGIGYRHNLRRLRDGGQYETHVRVLGPYGVPGLPDDLEVITESGRCEIKSERISIPPRAIEPHLPGYQFAMDGEWRITAIRTPDGAVSKQNNPKILAIDPDRWGRSWRTSFDLHAAWFMAPPDFTPDVLDPVLASRHFLAEVCGILNRVLDVYSFVTGKYDLPLIEPEDIPRVDAEYRSGGETIGSFSIDRLVYLWWRDPVSLASTHEGQLRSELLARPAFPLHWSLYTAAQRKSSLGDYRGGVVDAISAVEAIVAAVVEAEYTRRNTSRTEIDYHMNATWSIRRRITDFLPALFNGEVIPPLLKRRVLAANSKRNHIVHRGNGVSPAEARSHIDACGDLMTTLDVLL